MNKTLNDILGSVRGHPDRIYTDASRACVALLHELRDRIGNVEARTPEGEEIRQRCAAVIEEMLPAKI